MNAKEESPQTFGLDKVTLLNTLFDSLVELRRENVRCCCGSEVPENVFLQLLFAVDSAQLAINSFQKVNPIANDKNVLTCYHCVL